MESKSGSAYDCIVTRPQARAAGGNETAAGCVSPPESMGLHKLLWRHVPLPVRAILIGLAVMMAGQLPWSFLVTANLRTSPSAPWAAAAMAAYLTLYWRYLNGWGGPQASAESRHERFRARGLPLALWARAMAAGVLAVAAAVMLEAAYSRFVSVPSAAPSSHTAAYPWFTVLLLLMTSGAVAGIAEEAGFRGYMQSILERAYGPAVAIAIVSVVFAAIHFTHGVSTTLPRLPYYLAVSAIYGLLTYRTGSILPALTIHAGGDALEYLVVWQRGAARVQSTALLGGGGTFWMELAGGLVMGAAAVWFYRNLPRAGSGATRRLS